MPPRLTDNSRIRIERDLMATPDAILVRHLCHARRNPVACTAVDEFLAELEARMASATRAGGVHAPPTAEALQVIAAADQGGTPMFTSANLARIAKENGVDVSSEMTPNDIIAELRQRQQPGS
jgi:hypothetical protein